MKKLVALTSICLLMSSMAFAGQPTEADQKWLEVVEKKISSGETQISTPTQARVTLLKEWAATKGFATKVTQSDKNFRIELSKSVAQK